jgi:hypothetical protein
MSGYLTDQKYSRKETTMRPYTPIFFGAEFEDRIDKIIAMKKLIIILTMVLPVMAFAQVQQGRSFLSGGIGFNTNSPKSAQLGEPGRFTHFDINAKYGFMIGDTWAIGISPSFSTQMQKYLGNSKNVSNDFSIGPFIRKYFPLSNKFYFHLDASYSYETLGGYTQSSGGDKTKSPKSTSNVIAILPGASYFVTDRVALTATIGKLSYSNFKNGSTSDSSGFDLNFGITSLTLGAAVYF